MTAVQIAACVIGALVFSIFVGLVVAPFFGFCSEQDASDRAESEASVFHHNSEL